MENLVINDNKCAKQVETANLDFKLIYYGTFIMKFTQILFNWGDRVKLKNNINIFC